MKSYFKYFTIHLKSQLEYRLSFVMTMLGQFLVSFGGVFGVYFMFQRFHEVDGFTMHESLLCYSVVIAGFALSETFARGFDLFPRLVRSGELDRILVRPRSLIFQILVSEIEFARLGKLFQAAVVMAYAIPNSGVVWNLTNVFVYMLMIFSGFVIFTSVFILYAGVSFFTVEGLEFMNIFTHGGKTFGEYPYSIYGEGALKFVTYVIPIALFQYYPFLYITGRETGMANALAPVFGCLFIIPCLAFWCFGLSRYKSTGS